MSLRTTLTLSLALLLGGCAGLNPGSVAPPQVSLANVRIAELGLFEQRYLLDLRVRNPNGFEVPIAGFAYRLAINGEPFGTGVSDQAVNLRAHGETRLSVELVGNTSDTLRQLQRLAEGRGDTLDYELEGEVQLQGRNKPLPFAVEGKLGDSRRAPRGTAI